MGSNLIVLRLYQTAEVAHVVRIALEGQGVTVFVFNENYMQGDGPIWPADGVRLCVPESEVATATEILARKPSTRAPGILGTDGLQLPE